MTEYNREEILKTLKFNDDNPDFDSDFFNFEEFKQQLVDFLLGSDINTPYTIAVHGEWGEGKTSLIGRVYDAIKVTISEKSKNNKLGVIWLDAWQYEKLDPVGALFQLIIDEYKDHPNLEEFKRVAKGVGVVVLDIFLKSVTLKTTSLEEIENLVNKYLDSSTEKLESIKTKLENLVKGNRLIIFVDDLDRCSVDNVLEMLEAIKMLLSAKGVIFVIAVDITKLERAWELRYSSQIGLQEGREHLDKIFQLKLSLPPKEQNEIQRFIVKKAESIPEDLRRLMVMGCPKNPRKIKKILNLLCYLVSTSSSDPQSFQKSFPVLLSWSICTVAYPGLSSIIKEWPQAIVQTGILLSYTEEFEDLHYKIESLKNRSTGIHYSITDNLVIPHTRIYDPRSSEPITKILVKYPTIKIMEYLDTNKEAFYFIKELTRFYNIKPKVQSGTVEKELTDEYDLTPVLKNIIDKSGLIA